MAAYLLKTEPGSYSMDDLLRDGETTWDGVTNPQAVKNLREMKAGDQLIIYHTGDERTAVGTAKVISVDSSNPKTPLVRIKAAKKLKEPKTLSEIKAARLFADSLLVRMGRLSVVPISEDQYHWLIGN